MSEERSNDEEAWRRQVVELLKELVNWTRASGYTNIRATLVANLDTEEKVRVYRLTDGEKSTRQIQAATGVDKNQVSQYWRAWERAGIVVTVPGTRGRRRALFSLEDFGIDTASLSIVAEAGEEE